jgi:hypothetical protein
MYKVSLERVITDNFKSKKAFSEAMGVSRWTVDFWIKNPGKIKAKYIVDITRLTNVPIEQIKFN